jgi:hypothetical protein
VLTAGTAEQLGSDIDGAVAGDQFGQLLALSADGMRVAVGAPESLADSGHGTYLRIRQRQQLGAVGGDITDEAAGDQFGTVVES